MRKLNELEGVTLGVIHKRQPCTAYQIRMELKASPSSHWRGSAGAIYPLLARLEKEALIKSAEDVTDMRGRKLLTLTQEGDRSLKIWMKTVVEPEIVAAVFDPVRTRIFFLNTLSRAEQIRLADNTIKALETQLIETRRYLKERPAKGDLFEHLGAVGGVVSTQSRIDYMKIVLGELKEQRQSPARQKAV